jgi:hypothetical protein
MNSYKTAITRTKPSAPMTYLASHGLLMGDVLDYGCGKGFDAEQYLADKYDPYYYPTMPKKLYKTITCNYVLNTISREQGFDVLNIIQCLLTNGGTAYITVRRDVKQPTTTSKGTYQWPVYLALPIVKETKSYCIYKLTSDYTGYLYK